MTAPIDYGNPPGQGPLRPNGVTMTGLPNADDKKNSPATRSKASSQQMPALVKMRDVSEGNERIKEKRTEYLPMEMAEDPRMYANRLARSVFTNYTQRTAEGLTGFVFAKDPKLGEDVPPEIAGTEETEGHWENIDNAGTHGDVFIRERFQDDITAGHSAILVEFPNTGGTQTAADERTQSNPFPVRPYWVPVLKENMLSWRYITVNGRTVLDQMVLYECTTVPDGLFGEREQERYRVLNYNNGAPGWRVLEITEDKSVIQVDAGWFTNQDEIPLAECYTSGRKAAFVSKPPLLDVADLNVAHYQQDSDYKNSIHLTCVPLLVETGVEVQEGVTVVVGAGVCRQHTNPDATVEYVSHDGAALGSARQALEDIKSDIGSLGLAMLAPQKRSAETAEAKRIDKGASDSALSVSARGLQDGVERALYFHARYLRKDSGGSISINRSFNAEPMSPEMMNAYATLAEKLGLPVRVILEKLQAGGVIDDAVDLDELEGEMAAEKAARDAQRQAEMAAQVDAIKAGDEQPPVDQRAA